MAVVTFGLPVDIEPHVALLAEVHRSAGHVQWLGNKIAGFDTDDELTQSDMSGRSEKPAVWVEMYNAERAHLARVCKACIDAGIAERQVQLAEAQADAIIGVIEAVLAATGLDAATLARARDAVPGALRAIGGGA